MPRHPHPSDWNRLFDPSRRRRGPIGIFFFFTFLGCLALLFFIGGKYGVREAGKRTAELHATQTPAWGTAYAMGTATSAARMASAQRLSSMPRVVVVDTAGNFRSAPDMVPQTVVGSILQGDRVALLENREVDGHVWYRVRLTQTAGTLARGTEGWVSATLLEVPVVGVSGNPPTATTAPAPAP